MGPGRCRRPGRRRQQQENPRQPQGRIAVPLHRVARRGIYPGDAHRKKRDAVCVCHCGGRQGRRQHRRFPQGEHPLSHGGDGYYVAEPYWGKGVGTKAVADTCRYVFEHTDILRIFAEPFSHNRASCRVLEKAGFVLEGVMRKNAVKNGEVVDMMLYAMIKP